MDVTFDLRNINQVILNHFFPLLENKKEFLILRGGYGSGKSVFAVQKCLLRIIYGAMKGIKHDILVVMKTASSMKSTIIKEFQKWVRLWFTPDLFRIIEKQILFEKFGSQITFIGIDDPEKIKSSVGFTSVLVEEANRIHLRDFEELLNRIRGVSHTYVQYMLAFNPESKLNWIYNYFFSNPTDYIRNNTTYHHSMLKDNYILKKIDPGYIERIKSYKEYNINKYNVGWLGEWGSLEGIVFNNWIIADSFPDNFNETVYGIDFGYNVPSSILQVNEKDDEFYLKEILYEKKLTTNDLISRMDNLIPKEHKKDCYIYADSAEPKTIEEIYRAGYNCHSSDKGRRPGVDFVKSKKLHIHKDSYNLQKEIEGYVYATDKQGNSLEIPVKFDDHLMDPLRYAIFTHYRNKQDYNLIGI